MTQINRFKLGLVIVVGFSLMVVLVIWMGASRYFEKHTFLVTYIDESVQGLEQGSAVRYRGVTIGTVESIKVAPDGKLIEVIMKVSPDAKIDFSKMRTRLATAGITGLKFINIDFTLSNLSSPKLTFEAPYPVVLSEPSEIKALMSSINTAYQRFMELDIEGVSERLKDSLESVNTVVSQLKIEQIVKNVEETTKGTAALLEKERIDRIMSNIEKIMENTEKTSDGAAKLLESSKIEKIMENIEEATINIERATSSLEKTSSRIEEMTGGSETKNTLQNIRDIAKKLQKITAFVEKQTQKALIAETFQEAIFTLKGFREDFHRMEYSFRKTTKNMDSTMRSVKKLTDYLERDPASLLRGRTE